MLAIIIPYYKLTFFEATLDSLAAQTNQNFKVYIGDDASEECLKDLLSKYEGKFKFLYHRFATNLGGISLTQQWERCIALAGNEEWIMILGDDDVIGDNVVEKFYENLQEVENENISVVRFATVKIDEKGNLKTDVYYHPKFEKATDFLFRRTRTSLSEYVFLKTKVIDCGFKNLPIAWFSDVLAILEFSDLRNIFTINTAIIKVRISDISISGSSNNYKLKSEATFKYYSYLISKKSEYFNVDQKKNLLIKLEKCYINDKTNLIYFFKISKIYLSKFLFKDYLKFIRSVFCNYFN